MDHTHTDSAVMDDVENKSADEADFNDATVMDDDEDKDKNAAAADCGNRQLTKLCYRSYIR